MIDGSLYHGRRRFLRLTGVVGAGGLLAVGPASARRPEERTGTVLTVSPDGETGTLRAHETGEDREFKNPAQVSVQVGDDVIYVTVEAANGTEVNIIKEQT